MLRDENKLSKVASQMSDQLDGWSDMPPVNKLTQNYLLLRDKQARKWIPYTIVGAQFVHLLATQIIMYLLQ